MLSCARPRILVATSLTAIAIAISIPFGPGALAAPSKNVCVQRARGVPTRDGPPKWVAAWPGVAGTEDKTLDDPRWQGAAGHSFRLGSARSPLQFRALWSDQGGDHLYLSFILDLEGHGDVPSGTVTARDLFLGFRRATPLLGDPNEPGDDEYGYIFQFHLTSNSSSAFSVVKPVHCARWDDSPPSPPNPPPTDGCSEAAAQPKDHWRVYIDRGQTDSCGGQSGRKFDPLTGATLDTAPFTWMDAQDSVRYWKDPTANRWAVQLRLPLVAAGQPISAGIEKGATFWYQASAGLSAGTFAYVGSWPRGLDPVCPEETFDYLVHPDLTTEDNYSRLTTYSGAPPAGCDAGIRLTEVGAFPDFTGTAAQLATDAPGVYFKALRANGTPVVNTVVAQPENTSDSAIQAPLMARFRLAAWGSAPWSDPSDTGKWKDMRGTVPTVSGQQPGICLGNSDPNAADTCAPAVTIPAHGKAAISFQWTIGNDTGTGGIGASEYCKFGLTPPAGQGVCEVCSCTGQATCDEPGDPGTRSTKPSGGAGAYWPCVSNIYKHQCMLVELSAPNGDVDFVQQSVWNNMNFAQMSIAAQEALIDARKLPVGRGQREQDIYLIVMPRNMPRSLPPEAQDGTIIIRARALEQAEKIADPYLRDLSQPVVARPSAAAPLTLIDRAEADQLVARIARKMVAPQLRLDGRYAERLKRISRAVQYMSPTDFQRVSGLMDTVVSDRKGLDLNLDIVRRLGSELAAEVVPTLEIYPFYRPLGAGPMYVPMTAFTMFLSHEGAMQGMSWEIDGATRVGQNMFRMQIPVGRAKRIQVRAQAIEGNSALLPAGNPKWPCSGGCCPSASKNCGLVPQSTNVLPGLLAGLYAVLRRRRRRAAPAPTMI